MTDDTYHVSLVICGHADAGKSTAAGRLIFDLGGISEPEMQKLKDEAKALGKESFAFAFYMDKTKEERARGVTIDYNIQQYWTKSYHYTIIDVPGHPDFIKNMITGASQANVGLLLVPADEYFYASIAKAGCNTSQLQGKTREHARLLNALGISQLIVGVNKMDSEVAKFGKERFEEIKAKVTSMLVEAGWKKDFVVEQVPVLPISCLGGDNLITKSTNMDWFKGCDVLVGKEKIHIDTLADALEKMVQKPERKADAKLRMPVSGVYRKGPFEVITGRIEQGTVKPNDEVLFVPSRTKTSSYADRVISLEMHHKQMASAGPGDNVGLLIKSSGLINVPNVGDVMIQKDGDCLKQCKSFIAEVEVINNPGQLKKGYCPVAFVRTARAPLNVIDIEWKMSKEAGSTKVEDPEYVTSGDVAQILFQPQKPFVVDTFEESNGLGRIAMMEDKTVVMIGKVTQVNYSCPSPAN